MKIIDDGLIKKLNKLKRQTIYCRVETDIYKFDKKYDGYTWDCTTKDYYKLLRDNGFSVR
jgi:methyltransferase-like protein